MSHNFTKAPSGTITVSATSGSAVIRITDQRCEHISITPPSENAVYDVKLVSSKGFVMMYEPAVTGSVPFQMAFSLRGNATLYILNATETGDYAYQVTLENILG